MADKNDVVILNLDRPRLVWFGHKALKTLCAMTGTKLDDLGGLFQDADFDTIEKVMYCGFLTDAKKNNEVLKMEDMEDLLDSAPYHEITTALEKALFSSLGSEESNEKN